MVKKISVNLRGHARKGKLKKEDYRQENEAAFFRKEEHSTRRRTKKGKTRAHIKQDNSLNPDSSSGKEPKEGKDEKNRRVNLFRTYGGDGVQGRKKKRTSQTDVRAKKNSLKQSKRETWEGGQTAKMDGGSRE